MRKFNNILITGGAGFIGSNLINFILTKTGYSGKLINLDKLTYAGNPENLNSVKDDKRYAFHHGDICDFELVDSLFKQYNIDCVIHLAAESHVDRSIHGPAEFINTNINGTFNLLEVARQNWNNRSDVLFHHVSTDEVYGSLGNEGYFHETTQYDPRSPYSASKASSDHLVMAYFHTYNLPVTMSNCSNNYGPLQFPEKLIPLMILNMLEGKQLPVYGDGKNIRDWLYVEDHCEALWRIVHKAKIGETYNVGGENEWENIKLVNVVCEIVAQELDQPIDKFKKLITFVKDRKGHDRRYAIDCSKIKQNLNWKPSVQFEDGLKQTVKWYLSNESWISNILSGNYKEWVRQN